MTHEFTSEKPLQAYIVYSDRKSGCFEEITGFHKVSIENDSDAHVFVYMFFDKDVEVPKHVFVVNKADFISLSIHPVQSKSSKKDLHIQGLKGRDTEEEVTE